MKIGVTTAIQASQQVIERAQKVSRDLQRPYYEKKKARA